MGGGRFCEARHAFTFDAGGRVMNNGKKKKGVHIERMSVKWGSTVLFKYLGQSPLKKFTFS